MSKPLLITLCLLLGLPPALGRAASVSPEDIVRMHNFGVKVSLPGEYRFDVVPANMDPGRLMGADQLSFRGLDLQALPEWLGRLSGLQRLDLADTGLNAGQLAVLGELPSLVSLDLSGVALFSDGAGSIEALWPRLGNLRELKLVGTGGSAKAYGNLAPLNNLVELELADNGLTSLPIGLGRLQQLQRLDLSGSALGGLDIGALPPNLKLLDLSNSGLTSLTCPREADLPKLAALKLTQNATLRIDERCGDLFHLQRLVDLQVDNSVRLPQGWQDRMAQMQAEQQRLYEAERARLLQPQLAAFKEALPGRMVALPAGCFYMGSPDDQPERSPNQTLHQVCVSALRIGKYEVTFAEYDLFCEVTGRGKPDDATWGRDSRPVINVSWQDATAYAQWVSQLTGQRYRLPTEAEWEYAARAGTTTPFWTGECIHTDQANYNGNEDYNNCGARTGVYLKMTQPAGSYPANPWGLYDTAGNVWEWTCSAYDEYDGQRETQCVSTSDAQPRALRGGSWDFLPYGLASAARLGNAADFGLDYLGLRLAQDQ